MSNDEAPHAEADIDLVLDLPRGNARLEHDAEKGQFILTVEDSHFRYIIPDHAVQAWLSILAGCHRRQLAQASEHHHE